MTILTSLKRFAMSLLLASLYLGGIQQAQATLLNISQTPLVLSDSVAPNLVFTIDDSGSMREAFIPESIESEQSTRRAKSSTYNSLYYNPAVTYTPPPKFDSNGTQTGTYTTSFTQAYYNGLKPSLGSLNLSNNFRVSWWYKTTTGHSTNFSANDPDYGSGSPQFASNPAQDFSSTLGPLEYFNSRFGGCERAGYQNISCTGFIIYSGSERRIITEDQTRTGVPAYYYVYDTSLNNCNSSISSDNCYRKVDVTSNEQQNFANWYSFYRNRALATTTAARIAFSELPSSIRVTWQGLNQCTSLNSTSQSCGNDNRFRSFTPSQREHFFSWLDNINFYDGTPLKSAFVRAGEFLKTAPAWQQDPNTSSTGTIHSCRPSYHVAMTDGLYANENTISPTRQDSQSFTLPDQKNYNGSRHPFSSETQNTLADIAMNYWATDLNSSLGNNLKPIINVPNSDTTTQYWDARNDPANWQHMSNFIMGLGLSRSLNNTNIPWDGNTYSGAGYQALISGTSWPDTNNDSGKIYDLWHAAINSRGEFFSVDTPDAMVNAFRRIINRIGDFNTSASAPAVDSSQVDGLNSYETYETEFSSEDWSGDIRKYTIDNLGNRSLAWSAKNLATTSRTAVYMANSTGTARQDFTWSNLSTAQKAMFNINPDSNSLSTDSRGEARLNYVRGDRGNEGSGDGNFRRRNSLLGDIVNSSPVLVQQAQYLPYLAERIDGGSGSYSAFANAQTNRTPMLYVGANDGMLHAINANTGREVYAFVPTAVLPNLFRLSGQGYRSAHRFFVDGTPTVADVYYGGAWHTVLVGNLRGGGRSLFALDITTPSNPQLLWEFTHADLGYTFAQPTIARLHNGRWAVVTGNGYGNQSGNVADRAALFVLDIQTGQQLTPSQAPLVVSGDTTRANGLSSVRLADNNSDGIADYAYAGDIQGNLWRFDLFGAANTSASDPFSGISNGTISVSYGGRPLFTAVDGSGNAQTIMGPPSLVRHPTQTGYLVLFGTGKYFETTDGNVDTSRTQSLYAIWDRKTRGESTSSPPSITRSSLLTQTITSQTSASGSTVRLVSQNAPQWYRTGTTTQTDANVNQWGWKLDLAVSGDRTGEMMTRAMVARGQTLLFATLTPNSDPCESGAESWLYGLDAYSGGRTLFNVMDINNDGVVDLSDRQNNANVVSGLKVDSGSGFGVIGDHLFFSEQSLAINYGPNATGRQTWQVIPETEE